MEGAVTEIKLWIAASDCEDVSVTAIFCWCSKCTFTLPRLPTKNTESQRVPRSHWEATHAQKLNVG